MKSITILSIILLQLLSRQTNCECLTEKDLDYETCFLVNLTDSALANICDGVEEDIEDILANILELEDFREFTHDEYVRGAEECLMMKDADEDEGSDLEEFLMDPDGYVADMTEIITEKEGVYEEFIAKLSQRKEVMAHAKELLEAGEELKDKPDVLGVLLKRYITEDPSLLSEFLWLFEEERDPNEPVRDPSNRKRN